MENIGWEIRPAGWILLFILVGILIYYIVSRTPRLPDENQ